MARAQPGKRIAILASGRGSNALSLIEACRAGLIKGEVVLLASNRPTAPALELARAAGIATLSEDSRGRPDRRAWDLAFLDRVATHQPDLIVLAGFMRRLHADAVVPWYGHMVNIHPSLLPAYPGLDTHRRVLAAGDRQHGASVHFVSAELDAGPVFAQCRIQIGKDDTADSLAQRLLPHEHRLLVTSVAHFMRGDIRLDGRSVLFRGQPLTAPLAID
ncbi:MAG TPA: phosphoribosylglycinamide formyltransferase [Mizugakiibacter sp.]|nr:phosphoribosylglycinamide formyltransferase [Mizugakiibacter sp.]